MQLDHVQLAIPPRTEDACRAFWTGLLGCRELDKPATLRARGGAWFSIGFGPCAGTILPAMDRPDWA